VGLVLGEERAPLALAGGRLDQFGDVTADEFLLAGSV
jgi:hypothetical protein